MGRARFYRQRIRTEAASVEAKTLFDYLASEIRRSREVCADEAALIAKDAMKYLNGHLGMRELGQIEFPAVVAEGGHFRRARRDQDERMVRLTVIEDDDASVLSEFGMSLMVTGRMARVIEEAHYQGCMLDANRLCVLFPLNVTAIRARLGALIDQGAMLPLAGMSRSTREKFEAPRPVLAVKRYLQGEKVQDIRRSLVVSRGKWREWWVSFRKAVELGERSVEDIAEVVSQPEEVVRGWLGAYERLSGDKVARKVLEEEVLLPWEAEESFKTKAGFLELLKKRHGYSPAAADEFCDFLREVSQRFSGKGRSGGKIVYIGVSSSEGPGRSLRDCQLEAVELDYVTPEDWALARRTSTKALKWARIERFATEAYAQGAALGLHDIAYLVSASVDAVRSAISRHPAVILPTRGRVADMGSTLSHAERVIDLFMWGYTETEICRRTGHSHESTERYLLDFAKVVYLTEVGMPVPAIRKATGFSKRVVEKYHSLYQKYSVKDYEFAMAKIRRFAVAHPPSRQRERKGDAKGDGG